MIILKLNPNILFEWKKTPLKTNVFVLITEEKRTLKIIGKLKNNFVLN